MRRILLIDDDPGVIETMGLLLRLEGYEVAGANTGYDGVRMILEYEPDVAIIDLRLPDITGIEVIRHVQFQTRTACVLLTGFGTCRDTMEALDAGAVVCADKPLIGDDVIETVKKVLSSRRIHREGDNHGHHLALQPESIVAHSLTRWAEVVVRFVASPEDAPTLRKFGRAVGVSVGGFRNWCRTAKLRAKRSVSFARALRATVRSQDESIGPEHLLNIVDSRTLRKFLVASGGTEGRFPSNVNDFLHRQKFIVDPKAVTVVRALLQTVEFRVQEPYGTVDDVSARKLA